MELTIFNSYGKNFFGLNRIVGFRMIRRLNSVVFGSSLELGSGSGFLKDFVPDLITSEIFHCPEIDVVLNGMELPFADGAFADIVMIDVFHHIPQPRRFFTRRPAVSGRAVSY